MNCPPPIDPKSCAWARSFRGLAASWLRVGVEKRLGGIVAWQAANCITKEKNFSNRGVRAENRQVEGMEGVRGSAAGMEVSEARVVAKPVEKPQRSMNEKLATHSMRWKVR